MRAGQSVSLDLELTVGGVAESILITAATPEVDVTSAMVAEDITLQLTEAVPTGRSHQSYLQLVPGVYPDDPESPGNPASKSGLNYRDLFGDQDPTRNQDLVAGAGGNEFGDGIKFSPPRRIFLDTRLNF